MNLVGVLCLSLSSCYDQWDCPGFSEDLKVYLPDETQLVFKNKAGETLTFHTSYQASSASSESRFKLSAGGPGKGYCERSASLRPSDFTDSLKLDFSIDENTCELRVGIASSLPSNDYFSSFGNCNGVTKAFGDTLKLETNTPTTAPRFSKIEIVYGRGIISIQDDVKKCIWSR